MRLVKNQSFLYSGIGSALLLSALISVVVYGSISKGADGLIQSAELLIYSGAEEVAEKGEKKVFSDGPSEVSNGQLQSSTLAFEGAHSCRTDSANIYGFSCEIPAKAGDVFLCRVWRFSLHGIGNLVSSGNWGLFRLTGDGIDSNGDGWDLLEMKVTIPDSVTDPKIKFYAAHPRHSGEVAFFDEFKVFRLDQKPEKCTPEKSDSLLQVFQPGFHLRPYRAKKEESFQTISLFNYHPGQVEVIGSSVSRIAGIDELSEIQYLAGFNPGSEPHTAEISIPASHNYIAIRVKGNPEIYREAILNWRPPGTVPPRQQLFANAEPRSNEVWDVSGDTIIFRKGSHQISEMLVVPSKYKVSIPAGVSLNFIDSAGFISLSPVKITGRAKEPVEIYSEDLSARGFTVLNASDSCVYEHVSFKGFNTLSFNGWFLTGAVSFHESPVRLSHVEVSGNVCEDALNLVRCPFSIDHLTIAETFADGFDADFCQGLIRNSVFSKTGNDGMDFSGSTISVNDCRVEFAGDKGLSAGEQATIAVRGGTITGCPIGFASKDKSILRVEGTELTQCNVGFAAYQKKPEFGPGTIIADKILAGNNELNYKLGDGSVLIWDKNEIRQE